jgi:hypothetical protein
VHLLLPPQLRVLQLLLLCLLSRSAMGQGWLLQEVLKLVALMQVLVWLLVPVMM